MLIDLLNADEPEGEESRRRLAQALVSGPLIIGEVVYAEVVGNWGDQQAFDAFLDRAGIQLRRSSRAALLMGGKRWKDYSRMRRTVIFCPSCGAPRTVRCAECDARIAPRQHVVADFLIGAHAVIHSDRLLTRDRGYYRTYFPELTLA